MITEDKIEIIEEITPTPQLRIDSELLKFLEENFIIKSEINELIQYIEENYLEKLVKATPELIAEEFPKEKYWIEYVGEEIDSIVITVPIKENGAEAAEKSFKIQERLSERFNWDLTDKILIMVKGI